MSIIVVHDVSNGGAISDTVMQPPLKVSFIVRILPSWRYHTMGAVCMLVGVKKGNALNTEYGRPTNANFGAHRNCRTLSLMIPKKRGR